MNHHLPLDLSADDASRLPWERLVDGELSRDEYRSLLTKLENNPQLWRQCAVAFLEAQALRDELPDLVPASDGAFESAFAAMAELDSAHDSGCSKVSPRAPSEVGEQSNWATWLLGTMVVAASVLLAFGLGVSVARMDVAPAGDANLVKSTPSAAPATVEQPTPPTTQESPQLAADSPAVESLPGVPGEAAPRGDLTLIVNGDRKVQLPVYDAKDLSEQWLEHPPRAIAEDQQKMLERFGYRVLRKQRMTSIRLPNGSYVLVPMEEIQVVPAGGDGFQ